MTSPPGDVKQRGRPRSPEVEERILAAAVALISEAGVAGTTINAVARRSGIARASIYLRWSGRDAMIMAALRRAIGREPFPLSGNLIRDIHRGVEQARAILSEPRFQIVLPELVRALLTEEPADASLSYDVLFPNRRRVADEYLRLAGGSGMRTDIEPDLVIDLVAGAMLNRLLATGKPPTKAAAARLADVVLVGLREPSTPPPARRRSPRRSTRP